MASALELFTFANMFTGGEQVLFNTAAQPVTSTTPAPIAGLSWPVTPGSYFFFGIFRIKQGSVNATQDVGFSGAAASFAVWYWQQANSGGTTASQWTVAGTPLGLVGVNPNGAANECYVPFIGIVTFSAAGTFEAMAALTNPSDGFTVQPGCIFVVRPLP